MKKLTKESIIEGMKNIKMEDLQRRLKDFYTEREKLKNFINKRKSLSDDVSILVDNNKLQIEVYEEELPTEIIERAKRSASMYNTPNEYATSVKSESAER